MASESLIAALLTILKYLNHKDECRVRRIEDGKIIRKDFQTDPDPRAKPL